MFFQKKKKKSLLMQKHLVLSQSQLDYFWIFTIFKESIAIPKTKLYIIFLTGTKQDNPRNWNACKNLKPRTNYSRANSGMEKQLLWVMTPSISIPSSYLSRGMSGCISVGGSAEPGRASGRREFWFLSGSWVALHGNQAKILADAEKV